MQTLYLDLFSGLSGDMFLGALIDLGVDSKTLERELKKLKLDGYYLHVARKQKSGIEGVKFDVHLEAECDEHHHEHEHSHGHEHGHSHELEHAARGSEGRAPGTHDHGHPHDDSRNFAQIQQLIAASTLSDWVKEKSGAVFRRVAIAEGKIHGLPPEQVHFHEVGAVDSIVDIVGACIGLELLGKPRVLAAPVVEGTGFVKCAHGRMPLPAPATLEIFAARGVAVAQSVALRATRPPVHQHAAGIHHLALGTVRHQKAVQPETVPPRFVARHHAHLAMATAQQRRPLPLDRRPQATRIKRCQLVTARPLLARRLQRRQPVLHAQFNRHVNCGNIGHDGRGRTLPVIHETSPLSMDCEAGSLSHPGRRSPHGIYKRLLDLPAVDGDGADPKRQHLRGSISEYP